jgi:cell division protein ZapD
MLPIRDGLAIVLRLLRESGRTEQQLARRGCFQLMMAGRSAQLIRVFVDRDLQSIPEISANKYAFNIRFVLPDVLSRAKLDESDVQFDITFCSL